MPRRAGRLGFTLLTCLWATALLPVAALGSELIGRDATNVRLQVDANGRALVSFRSEGRDRTVVAWGAVDARDPSRTQPQVAFSLALGGGIGANVCRPYHGPALPWRVAACTAPDGTHWAVQAWQRALPNYGASAAGDRAAWELRLSHWSGPLPVLEVATDWSYRRFHHLYGRMMYHGKPVFGFRSTRYGVPLDGYGRNVYVDTFGGYGAGWKRVNSFLSHNPGGTFCYGFYAHGGAGTGEWTRYRATVIGPGVAPDVMWQGPAPGSYDAARDAVADDAGNASSAGKDGNAGNALNARATGAGANAVTRDATTVKTASRLEPDPLSFEGPLEDARRAFETRYIRAALARAGGSPSRAARDLGLTRQGLKKLIARLGLDDAVERRTSAKRTTGRKGRPPP